MPRTGMSSVDVSKRHQLLVIRGAASSVESILPEDAVTFAADGPVAARGMGRVTAAHQRTPRWTMVYMETLRCSCV